MGERYGTPPHLVLEWPVWTLRLLEADSLMRKAREARRSDG